MNGSAAIHDFEIALAGHTSEDVEAVLPDGRFGAAEETGREMNRAIAQGDARRAWAWAKRWAAAAGCAGAPRTAHAACCCRHTAAALRVTVHVAIGTDTPHTHPAADPAAIGSATHRDFRLLCALVADLNDGGVYLNVGSAVVHAGSLSEGGFRGAQSGASAGRIHHREFRFPAALPAARQRGGASACRRRTGKGYAITGHHEIMIPLLAAALIEKDA